MSLFMAAHTHCCTVLHFSSPLHVIKRYMEDISDPIPIIICWIMNNCPGLA